MFLIGLCLMSFSVPVAIAMFSTLNKVTSSPYTYRFTNGFTEESVTTIAIIAVIAAIVGLLLMFVGYAKRKNHAKLTAIENHTKENVCPRCRVNVASADGKCPICGNYVKGR